MAETVAPLPLSTQRLLPHNEHPGLMLDKYAESYSADRDGKNWSEAVQFGTVRKVVHLTETASRQRRSMYQDLRRRHRQVLDQSPQVTRFACRTTGPLTLHLARASALENAGICLHPIYGFVYLPGSGLKGLTRAYAETIGDASPDQIRSVFGSVSGKREDEPHQAGSVVFHDAWGTEWPRLSADIVNNHHPDYYRDGGDGPGDWENPIPNYFLAVPPDTVFEFTVSARRDDTPADHLQLARQWMLAALCHFGAGAKTAAGYGSFVPTPLDDIPAPSLSALPQSRVESATYSVHLHAPAFLAGADQMDGATCDLRSATLRGQLRWWWRTLHAGYMDLDTLRKFESEIWGNTDQGSRVRIELTRTHDLQGVRYEPRSHASMSASEKVTDRGIPDRDLGENRISDPKKTTQGLWYASYGMSNQGRERHVLAPGASWKLRLIVSRRKGDSEQTARQIFDQARAAFWLLCHYGGVGAKGGKGFGSLWSDGLEIESLDQCLRIGGEYRKSRQMTNSFRDAWVCSPSLALALAPLEVVFPWPDVWSVLDQVGFSYQAFAKRYAHRREKWALGLPRRLGRSGHDVQGRFNVAGPARRRIESGLNPKSGGSARHTSPVRFHVEKHELGHVVRVLMFPAASLPDLETSRKILQELREFLEENLRRRAELSPPPSSDSSQSLSRRGRDRGDRRSSGPPSRDRSRDRQTSNHTVSVPEIDSDRVRIALEQLGPGQAVLKIVQRGSASDYTCQQMKLAPKIPAQFQPDGSIRIQVEQAPSGLPDGTFVLVQLDGNKGRWVETLGMFAQKSKPSRGPRRR